MPQVIKKVTKRKGSAPVTQTVVINLHKGKRGKATSQQSSSKQPISKGVGQSFGSEYAALTGVPYLGNIPGRFQGMMGGFNQPLHKESEPEYVRQHQQQLQQQQLQQLIQLKQLIQSNVVAPQQPLDKPMVVEDNFQKVINPVDVPRPLPVATVFSKQEAMHPVMAAESPEPLKVREPGIVPRRPPVAILPAVAAEAASPQVRRPPVGRIAAAELEFSDADFDRQLAGMNVAKGEYTLRKLVTDIEAQNPPTGFRVFNYGIRNATATEHQLRRYIEANKDLAKSALVSHLFKGR
jgi:hypothetical protein